MTMKLNRLYYVSAYLWARNERARCVLTAESEQDAAQKAREWASQGRADAARITSCRFICDTPATVFEEL